MERTQTLRLGKAKSSNNFCNLSAEVSFHEVSFQKFLKLGIIERSGGSLWRFGAYVLYLLAILRLLSTYLGKCYIRWND